MHWNIIFGIFIVLSACGDLVETSDAGACNSAIDSRNYDTALTVCTSRKDKASAYMGKAGYDIINLIKSSGTPVIKFTKPTALGKDDIAGASILNILQLSEAAIPDDDARATDIANSKTNLDEASALLQPYLNDNSQPLSTDEILLNTFAISFAMQLNQLVLYDKSTTTTEIFPEYCSGCSHVDNLTCTPVVISDSDAQAKLQALDGHLWSTETNGSQCTRILAALNGLSGQNQVDALTEFDAWVDNESRGGLPSTLITPVCGPIASLTDYLDNLTDNMVELILSGDNTKAIKNAKNSSDALLIAVGCKE